MPTTTTQHPIEVWFLELGFTVTTYAERTGLSRRCIYNWIQCKALPKLEQTQQLAEILGLTIRKVSDALIRTYRERRGHLPLKRGQSDD